MTPMTHDDRVDRGTARPSGLGSREVVLALSAGIGFACAFMTQWLRVQRAKEIVRVASVRTLAFDQRFSSPNARVLILGDSTAVGLGADSPNESIGGLLAADHPNVEVLNAACSGACLGQVTDQLAGVPHASFDLVLLLVGGNDVIRGTPLDLLECQADDLLPRLRQLSTEVVWLGSANVGLAPLFMPPWSWLLSARSRRRSRHFEALAKRHDVHFLNFFREQSDDVFSRDSARYYAPDRVHPSSASYRYCYDHLYDAVPIRSLLRGPSQ